MVYFNDTTTTLCVKLNCDSTNRNGLMIPYLLIYEKYIESEIPTPSYISNQTEIKESDPMIIANESNYDFDFSIENCPNEEMKERNIEKEKVVLVIKKKASEWIMLMIKKDISAMNRDNLLKELNAQKIRVSEAEN